jgi:putative SOS response-associated peptidase YedK
MCGRYMMTSAPEAIRRLFRYGERPNFPPRSEIFPSEPIAVVTADRGGRHFRLMRWGFLPVWAKDPQAFRPQINARLETAADKPAFRGAMRHGRCLIPADGFYEWAAVPGERAKRRHAVTPADGGPIAFAGLWGDWAHADGSEIDGACILTRAAAGAVAAIHDRMPAVVPPTLFDLWLDATVAAPAAAAALAAARPPDWRLDPPAVASGRPTADTADGGEDPADGEEGGSPGRQLDLF